MLLRAASRAASARVLHARSSLRWLPAAVPRCALQLQRRGLHSIAPTDPPAAALADGKAISRDDATAAESMCGNIASPLPVHATAPFMRYVCSVEYNGWQYRGWIASRDDDGLSVASAIEAAVREMNPTATSVRVVGSGRTDRGVHALGQVCHIDIEASSMQAPPRCVSGDVFMRGVNHHLRLLGRSDVQLTFAAVVPPALRDSFHARHSALQRHYLYRVALWPNHTPPSLWESERAWNVWGDLNLDFLRGAVERFNGRFDFACFRNSACSAPTTTRTMRATSQPSPFGHWSETVAEPSADAAPLSFGSAPLSVLHLHFSSRSFLFRQIRLMVGAAMAVARGKLPVGLIDEALSFAESDVSEETMKRKAELQQRIGVHCAPPSGLYLARVDYPSDLVQQLLAPSRPLTTNALPMSDTFAKVAAEKSAAQHMWLPDASSVSMLRQPTRPFTQQAAFSTVRRMRSYSTAATASVYVPDAAAVAAALKSQPHPPPSPPAARLPDSLRAAHDRLASLFEDYRVGYAHLTHSPRPCLALARSSLSRALDIAAYIPDDPHLVMRIRMLMAHAWMREGRYEEELTLRTQVLAQVEQLLASGPTAVDNAVVRLALSSHLLAALRCGSKPALEIVQSKWLPQLQAMSSQDATITDVRWLAESALRVAGLHTQEMSPTSATLPTPELSSFERRLSSKTDAVGVVGELEALLVTSPLSELPAAIRTSLHATNAKSEWYSALVHAYLVASGALTIDPAASRSDAPTAPASSRNPSELLSSCISFVEACISESPSHPYLLRTLHALALQAERDGDAITSEGLFRTVLARLEDQLGADPHSVVLPGTCPASSFRLMSDAALFHFYIDVLLDYTALLQQLEWNGVPRRSEARALVFRKLIQWGQRDINVQTQTQRIINRATSRRKLTLPSPSVWKQWQQPSDIEEEFLHFPLNLDPPQAPIPLWLVERLESGVGAADTPSTHAHDSKSEAHTHTQ